MAHSSRVARWGRWYGSGKTLPTKTLRRSAVEAGAVPVVVGKMVIPVVNLGGETLATIYVEGKRVAVREGRD